MGLVKSFLTNPETLTKGLKTQQAEREEVNKPLKDRLAVIDDLLIDNRRQLERLLDLYLAGDFPKEMLTERKTRLEMTIEALERERVGLAMQLEAQTLTDEQVQTITEFAEKVSGGLEIAAENFEKRRQLIALLDVHATLVEEKGQQIAYMRCLIKETKLCLTSWTTRKHSSSALVSLASA